MANKYSGRVCVDGYYGHIVRIIKNDKDEITHLDVEVSGVIDRYRFNQLQEYKKDE